jgi:hypothetical protein
MVEGQPKEPRMWIAPAQPFRYDPEKGLFCVRQECSPLETMFTPSELTSVTNLSPRLNQYPEFQLDCETGLLLGPGGSLIELPNLRRLLAKIYPDEQKRITINQKVNKIIRSLNPITASTPEISGTEIPDAFNQYGVITLNAGETWLRARPDSYAVYIPHLLVIDDKHGHHRYFPNLSAAQIIKDTDAPLAYWPNSGSEAAIISLYAGAGTLASLAMGKLQSSSAAIAV